MNDWRALNAAVKLRSMPTVHYRGRRTLRASGVATEPPLRVHSDGYTVPVLTLIFFYQFLTLYSIDGDLTCMDHWSKNSDGAKLNTGIKTCPSATFATHKSQTD